MRAPPLKKKKKKKKKKDKVDFLDDLWSVPILVIIYPNTNEFGRFNKVVLLVLFHKEQKSCKLTMRQSPFAIIATVLSCNC